MLSAFSRAGTAPSYPFQRPAMTDAALTPAVDLSSLSRVKYAYLLPAVKAIYPTDPAEFRAAFQPENLAAPEYRSEGVAAMTDDELSRFATALQSAAIHNPAKIDELWEICCTLGQRVSQGGAL